MKKSKLLWAGLFVLAFSIIVMPSGLVLEQALAEEGRSFWVGVEKGGISSHQPGRPWCPNGSFLVAFDLDGDRRYSAHDTPVVGQAMCSSPRSSQNSWGSVMWVAVEKGGISSHQPGRPWCPSGSFLVAFDLDGDRRYSAHDTPVVGQAMCANLASRSQGLWGSCFWVGVERARINSHQPGSPWCPDGTFMVAFDLDARGNYDSHDSPVVGQAMCCSPP